MGSFLPVKKEDITGISGRLLLVLYFCYFGKQRPQLPQKKLWPRSIGSPIGSWKLCFSFLQGNASGSYKEISLLAQNLLKLYLVSYISTWSVPTYQMTWRDDVSTILQYGPSREPTRGGPYWLLGLLSPMPLLGKWEPGWFLPCQAMSGNGKPKLKLVLVVTQKALCRRCISMACWLSKPGLLSTRNYEAKDYKNKNKGISW